MSPAEVLAEYTYPLRSVTVVLALIVFAFLLAVASMGGMAGTWLYLVVFVAIARYLVLIAESRARDRDAEPPGIEYFTLTDNL